MKVPELDTDPFSEAFLSDPFVGHDELRNAGPVVWLEKLGCYGMARFAEVRLALRDHETFISGRGVGLSDFAHEEPWRPPSLLLEVDPPLHDRTRGLMNRVSALSSIRERMPDWRAKAEGLVASLVGRRHIDAVADDVEVGDATIPEGSKVLLFLASANRDPRKWDNPDSFDICRSASGHVGFGFGIHQCLGQMVARFEGEAVLGALIGQVASIKLTGMPKRRLNNTLYAIESLPIELTT